MKYKFIVFEGIDGSGKTTLINNIKKQVKEEEYFFTKEPGNTNFKSEIYSLLQLLQEAEEPFTEYLVFAAERTHHIKTKILPALKKNKIVISDRFIDSSIVYQSECNKEFIETVFKKTNYDIIPTLTFFCKIKPEIAQKRIQERKDNNFLDEKYLTRLYILDENYNKLYHQRKDTITLDMSLSIEALTAKCIDIMKNIS